MEDVPRFFLIKERAGRGVQAEHHILTRFVSRPLDSLDDLPEELQEVVAHIITTAPVNQFLKVSHFQASPTKRVPLTYVESYHVDSVA